MDKENICFITIEINCAWTICINFGDNAVQIVTAQFIIQCAQDLFQCACRDVTIPLSIVQPESFFELLLHGLTVFFFQKMAGYICECIEIDLSGCFWIMFSNNTLQFTIIEQLAHGIQNGCDFQCFNESRFIFVEHLECFSHNSDFLLFIILQNQFQMTHKNKLN